MIIDVTDATIQAEVIERSKQVPVVIDLWAPWCGPCKTLGPILEKVVSEKGGRVVLAKIDVDQNPQCSAAFQVQSIPAVYAMKDGQPVNGFMGAQGEAFIREFVDGLLSDDDSGEVDEITALLEAGDEVSVRQALELEPDNHAAICALALLEVDAGNTDEALALLGRVPETPETRRIAALARTNGAVGDIAAELDGLLDQVKADADARQRYIDLLDVLGPEDPRTASYRRQLATRLF